MVGVDLGGILGAVGLAIFGAFVGVWWDSRHGGRKQLRLAARSTREALDVLVDAVANIPGFSMEAQALAAENPPDEEMTRQTLYSQRWGPAGRIRDAWTAFDDTLIRRSRPIAAGVVPAAGLLPPLRGGVRRGG